MKLLFYIPGLVDGGAERVIASLASHFANDGHEVSLAVEFEANTDGPPLDPSVKLVALAKGHAASIRHLSKIMADDPPDIALAAIASCNFKLALSSALASTLSRITGKSPPPLVLTYHGFEEYRTGWMSWLGYVSLPIISRIAARVVPVSDSLLGELASRWRAKKNSLQRIYNPVKLPQYAKTSAGPADEQKLAARDNIIVSVGRLVPGKRFDLLIRAFAKITTPSARLIIAGDGEERAALLALADELGVANRIELPGFMQDTGNLYRQAKCFALVSEKESFGLVLVEALAHGLPVIATNSGGPREVLDDGRHGVLLNAEPMVSELARALETALADPGDPAPRIKHAQKFDMQTGADQYEALFAQILKERNGP